MKTHRIEARVSAKLKAKLERIAKRRELSLSELVREALEHVALAVEVKER